MLVVPVRVLDLCVRSLLPFRAWNLALDVEGDAVGARDAEASSIAPDLESSC